MRKPTRRVTHLITGAAVLAATALSVPTVATAAPATTGATETYLVLFKGSSSPADAAASVTRAGGVVVADYAKIGVLVARSGNSNFDETMRADPRVEGAAATTGLGTRLEDVDADSTDAAGPPPGDLPNAPAGQDPLAPLQWDMRQINAPQAQAITGGSPSVVVGNIDTGLDSDHPDLVENIDFGRSVSCESGAPDQNPAAWDDRQGHGTHTAGTIAAAANGLGITGVAPNVKLAGIKASNDDGYFFPEMVVCAFMWAGTQHLDVTNNSYFVDPFLYNCRNEPVQRAIWKAVQRAVRYAMQEGVTVVAAEGNQSDDLSHPTVDVISPDFPPGNEQERDITNACLVLPVELPGVIGVTATGNGTQGTSAGRYADNLKSFYSSYGVSTADVTAPGGDSRQITPEAPNGRVLSTYPAEVPCSRSVKEPQTDPNEPTSTYCYLQGTSMAGPHVAGVAALVISRFGDAQTPQNGTMRPNQVEQFLEQTADPQTCPEAVPANYPPQTSGEPQECQGQGQGHTSWYGSGQVDALAAITNDRSNG